MPFKPDFQEIAHCGGKFSITTKTAENGRRSYSVGVSGSSPNAAALFGIYALPEGIPAGIIELGGIGQEWNEAPHPACIPVMIGSDSEGHFGHECDACGSYWRSQGAGTLWPLTCPYCGVQGGGHQFLTQGQLNYVRAFCGLFRQALSHEKDGQFTIDMDKVADDVRKGGERPSFYYVEETQQNKFTCNACGAFNDILGRYGYCSSCGTRNELQEFRREIERIRQQAKSGGPFENCVRDTVSAFDAIARNLTKQLLRRVPLVMRRKAPLEDATFQNLKRRVEDLDVAFGISLLQELSSSEIDFAIRAFHRRHVYEHNGGEVDEKYLADSGDTSVRLKQMLYETIEHAFKTTEVVDRLARNFHAGFHELFPPQPEPIKYHEDRKRRMKER